MSGEIAPALLRWFKTHGRHDLPWQKNPTAYRVWVSEIMLQQTQVKTAIPYYQRFMQRFPSLKKLANADQDEVLHYWTGLGYYARARNLHRCAQIIFDTHKGRFPQDIEELMALPGIGRSTAGAILTLACGQQHPILDGNVKRVLGRYFMLKGWPGKTGVMETYWQHAEQQTPGKHCAEYTQAIMDLGATVCTRSNPQCEACPLQKDCMSNQQGKQHLFPERNKKSSQRRVKETVFLILENQKGELLLQQQAQSGLWGGLWIFPQIEARDLLNDYCIDNGFKVESIENREPFQHKFSHFDLNIEPIYCKVKIKAGAVADNSNVCWYNPVKQQRLGMAAPVKKLIQQLRM